MRASSDFINAPRHELDDISTNDYALYSGIEIYADGPQEVLAGQIIADASEYDSQIQEAAVDMFVLERLTLEQLSPIAQVEKYVPALPCSMCTTRPRCHEECVLNSVEN